MAPHPSNPKLPHWHESPMAQTPGSAARGAADDVSDDDVAIDEHEHQVQQTLLGSMPGEDSSSYHLSSRNSQPSSQQTRAIPNVDFVDYQEFDNQSIADPRNTDADGDSATGHASTRVTRSRSAKQIWSPLFHSNGEAPLNRGDHSNPPYSMPASPFTPLKDQNVTKKRKGSTNKSSSKSVKVPRAGHGGPSKGKPSEDDAPGSPDGGGDGGEDSDEPATDTEPRPTDRPLRTLSEFTQRMIADALPTGLNLYVDEMRRFFIRVGTLCSGTDAPVLFMKLFARLKNPDGAQVFTTINCFGCEIEPYKQSFLMRNSKPELLFKDAQDFTQGDAQRARLITGAEAQIPSVDLFIAGTSCVDFSTLSSTKIREYAGLAKSLEEWKALKKKHGDKLSIQHLSVDSWRAAIAAMSSKTEKKNTSTKTFAAAINYAKWHQPKILIFENVESAPWEKLIESGLLRLLGYEAIVLRLDTKTFHIPQTRRRKYLVCFNHLAFTMEGARRLCVLLEQETLPPLEHIHENTVLDFLLPLNSPELCKSRNELEASTQAMSLREAVAWKLSRARHIIFRRKYGLPDLRLWIQWDENAHPNAPAKMWMAWVSKQPLRVLDLLECIFLYALHGMSHVHGQYDLRSKAQIIDCSQNVERIPPHLPFGRTGCLTPNAIPVLTLEARPITGTESLRLQGLPVENLDMSVETQSQLQDLAGNAMTTTVVGAVILAALSAVARVSQEGGRHWLKDMFQQGNYKAMTELLNSFHKGGLKVNHGPQKLLHFRVDAYILPGPVTSFAVRVILALGQRARRRCCCHHILVYSSVELYVCEVCDTSYCKSCKGNPEHALTKSPESLEELEFLPYAQAEHEFRKCFPSTLFMRSETDTLVQKLSHALQTSTYNNFQKDLLASAIIEGLCDSTYQLQFVEITDAVRLEYTAGSTFILRAIVEKSELVWYLHLDQFSHTGKELSDVLTTSQPIARAVLGPEEPSHLPSARSWEFWNPYKVSFPLTLEVQDARGLRITRVDGLEGIPQPTQRSIERLRNSVWKFYPKCGYPEGALWVCHDHSQKLFLFKEVDPIGKAQEDAFVISPTSREMGRTPHPESRPVLLRISKAHQIHREFKKVPAIDGPLLIDEGDELCIQGSIDGWWEYFEAHSISIGSLTNTEYKGMGALAKGAPTSIRRPGDQSRDFDYYLCDKYQSLLTTSLPILGKAEDIVKMQETLKTLDLTQQLDLAELARLIGPLYSAVEMALIGTGHRVTLIQKDVVLSSDCAPCAPKIPEVFYVKEKTGQGLATGSVVPRHRESDQRSYDQYLQSKSRPLHIDHNVTVSFNDWRMKRDAAPYVDLRISVHGHTLLQQARSHLPQHPAQYEDSTRTSGSLVMEVGVIEDPRIVLHPASILAPETVTHVEARHLPRFQPGLELFPEQRESLDWMLIRESLHPEHFVETEVAEQYLEKFRLRIHAVAERHVARRGRVVADNVGFGKTPTCLGLIDVQYDTDRKEFLDLRKNNIHLKHLIHLHATLVIVPNQLTQQWANEAKRFLSSSQYRIVMIATFAALQKLTVADLERADIVICSNQVFQDNKYHSEMSKYCSTNSIDKLRVLPKVYRAWYKQFLDIFRQVQEEFVQIVNGKDKTSRCQQGALLRHKLDLIRRNQQSIDGEEELSFAPPDPKPKQSGGKAAAKTAKKTDNDWEPSKLLEKYSFPRIIWDEFSYENIPVTEFVANCATMSKWMLSGTPPMDTLGDICRVAYLFNVHLARPLSLIKGRQPPVCENEPLAPYSDLESTSLFQSRHSPRLLVERHEQLLAFVRLFMRKNDRQTEVSKIERPIVVTMLPLSLLFYTELQSELRSRQYNANNVGSECRRRLMSLVVWKGKDSGRNRSVEALMIRASASPEDVLRQSGLTECDDREAANTLLCITEDEIRGMEDRGRELIAKAIFLAYRLTWITLSETKDEVDGQDERQLDYYQNLVELVEPVLKQDISMFQSWEAFESAMRMLIWDEKMREALGKFRNRPQHELPPILRAAFDTLSFCRPPTVQPVCPREDKLKRQARENFIEKMKFFAIFRDWVTKTPLHSRRWFLYDKVVDLDAAEKELLRLEWSEKVLWENNDNASADNQSRMVVPISKLRQPSSAAQPDDFDFEHLKSLDKSRRQRLEDLAKVSPETIESMKSELHDYKDTKTFWEEECNRRGLVAKSGDKKETLIARVFADMEKLATDKDYVSAESCGVALSDFPQQGKKRIRGGNMEVIFDGLMETVDDQSSVYERSIVVHARRNLQQVVADILNNTWVCHNPQCDKKYDIDAHYVSLLCGHVFCGQPDDRKPCGISLCQRHVKNVCIPLSKIAKEERVIAAGSLSGAINQDPDSYLDSEPAYKGSTMGPKARAVINLIRRIRKTDSVVVFVQNASMEKDIYSELAAAEIEHVTPDELSKNEAGSLEKFKEGDVQVLVQTISSEQAAGSNLHRANHVIFVSPLISRKQGDWNDQMKQALGRCVRYRQSKTVYVYHMVMDETIEVDTLEWRMKKEIIATDGQAVARFNECSTRDFLERYEGEDAATKLQLAPGEGRASSILPRDDIQTLMGDDYLSLASVKAVRTIDESVADMPVAANKGKERPEDIRNGEAAYLLEPAIEYEDQYIGDDDVVMGDYEEEDIYGVSDW